MNRKLNSAVDELLTSPRLMRRFRRNPARAMSRFGLSRREVEAVKSGHVPELLELGLDPALVWPQPANGYAMQSWLLRNARKLAPVALIAGLMATWPSASAAAPRTTPRSRWMRAARRYVRARPRVRRAFRRFGGTRALRARMRELGVSPARRRALIGRTRSIMSPRTRPES